jgi:hypothetical protein
MNSRWMLALAVVACGKKDPTPEPGVVEVGSTSSAAVSADARAPNVVRFDAAEIRVPVGKSKLHVAWSIPEGTAINDDAPFGVRWGSSDGLVVPPADIRGTGKEAQGGFDVAIEIISGADGAQLTGDVDVVVCDTATHAVCVPLKRRLELTFAVGKGSAQGRVTLPLPKAKP